MIMSLNQCRKAAEELGGFQIPFVINGMEAKWIDAWLGAFIVPKLGNGVFHEIDLRDSNCDCQMEVGKEQTCEI